MNYYAYIPTEKGKEPLGTDNRQIIRNIKKESYAIQKAYSNFKDLDAYKERGMIVKSFTNFYKDSTFKTIYNSNKQKR